MRSYILKHKKNISKAGKIYESFQIYLNNKLYWINKNDYLTEKELLIIEMFKTSKLVFINNYGNKVLGVIVIKEPFEHYYEVENKKSSKGIFKILKPKKINKIKESDPIYLTIEKKVKEKKESFNKKINEQQNQSNNADIFKGAYRPTEDELKDIFDEIKGFKTIAKPTSSTFQSDKQNNRTKLSNDNKRASFIKEIFNLVSKKKLSNATLQKLIKLMERELMQGLSLEENSKKIEELERKILEMKKKLEKKENIEPDRKDKLKLHNPQKILKWLKLFTTNNVIKYTTHLWDQNDLFGNYEEFINQLNEERKKNKFQEMPLYNDNLFFHKIHPFVFQNQLNNKQEKEQFGWGKHKIKIGWQFPDIIKQWVKDNPGRPPLMMELPDEIKPNNKIYGKTPKYFEDIINIFKKEIEFRDNDLYIETKILKENIIPEHQLNDENLKTLKGVNIYTNTEMVLKAIERIFRMIKHRSASIQIDIKSYEEKEKNKLYQNIVINHIDSFSDRNINDTKLKGETGDLKSLIETLISLCDFSIVSRFNSENKKEFYKIDYLYGEDKAIKQLEPRINKTEPVNGFQFILKFPKL